MVNQGPLQVLFDFSFSEFITTRIIKILFIIGILISAIGSIGFIVMGFSSSVLMGIVFLLLSPIVFLLYVLLARVWCEMIIVLFKIAENTSRMVEKEKHE
ncbi:MAG: DUF4282 domain-containing protein [bacterium]